MALYPYHRAMAQLLGEIGSFLGDLEGVFSTPQWGGRAYKLPGPGGSLKKPKLVAFIVPVKDRDAVQVAFKLTRDRAAAMIEKYAWVEMHSFSSLGGAGWVSATISSRRQLGPVKRLLSECRALYPVHKEAAPEKPAKAAKGTNPVTRHIDKVMTNAITEGWRPTEDF